MVEGGLRAHWIKKKFYFKGLKNIHAKRIENVARGYSRQGIVTGQEHVLVPTAALVRRPTGKYICRCTRMGIVSSGKVVQVVRGKCGGH